MTDFVLSDEEFDEKDLSVLFIKQRKRTRKRTKSKRSIRKYFTDRELVDLNHMYFNKKNKNVSRKDIAIKLLKKWYIKTDDISIYRVTKWFDNTTQRQRKRKMIRYY